MCWRRPCDSTRTQTTTSYLVSQSTSFPILVLTCLRPSQLNLDELHNSFCMTLQAVQAILQFSCYAIIRWFIRFHISGKSLSIADNLKYHYPQADFWGLPPTTSKRDGKRRGKRQIPPTRKKGSQFPIEFYQISINFLKISKNLFLCLPNAQPIKRQFSYFKCQMEDIYQIFIPCFPSQSKVDCSNFAVGFLSFPAVLLNQG